MSNQNNNKHHNEISNSSSREQTLSKSPSAMIICHSKSSLQLGNKLSPINTTQNTSLSQQIKKSHSISSPYFKKDGVIINNSGNQLSSLSDNNNSNTKGSKYLRSPSHLLTLINKKRFHNQNGLQSRSMNPQNDKEVNLKQLRKQVYKFFDHRREEMKSKQRSFNYMLPKISAKQQQTKVRYPSQSNEQKQKQQQLSQQEELSKQSRNPHSSSKTKLSPQVLSFRRRYQQQLSKIHFQLPKSLQKKQRFFDLSSQMIQEINNEANAIIKEGDILKEDRISELPEVKNTTVDEKNTTKFSLLHRANKAANQSAGSTDHAVPGFLMERLSLGGTYSSNSVNKLKRGSFLTQLHYQQ